MGSLEFGIEGFRLESAAECDREYVLGSVEQSVLNSVNGTEKDLSELWIGSIRAVAERNLDNNSEAFVLRDSSGRNAGVLWMGASYDQFTCEPTGYILNVFVDGEFRGKGLGKALIASAEAWCRSKGLICLTLNVGSSNINALALYDKAGFEPQSQVMRKFLVR